MQHDYLIVKLNILYVKNEIFDSHVVYFITLVSGEVCFWRFFLLNFLFNCVFHSTLRKTKSIQTYFWGLTMNIDPLRTNKIMIDTHVIELMVWL